LNLPLLLVTNLNIPWHMSIIVVGIAMGWKAGVRFPAWATIFSSPQRPDWLWGPSASYPMGTGGKTAGREADHSPPSIGDIRRDGAIPPLPQMSSWRSA
jgi:hypothetical protein